jgi:hypothetical protein
MVKKVKIKEEIAKRMECLVKFQKVANHFTEKLKTDFGARMFKTIIGDHRDETILQNDNDDLLNANNNTSRHSFNYIEKSCRSPCLYAKDAFILLFTNNSNSTPYATEANMILLDLYVGKKFAKHIKKECYVPILVNDECGFLKKTFAYLKKKKSDWFKS